MLGCGQSVLRRAGDARTLQLMKNIASFANVANVAFTPPRLLTCLITSLLTFAAHAQAPSVTAPQVVNPSRVLFVGNSYFYYNDSLHNIIRRMVMAAEAGQAGVDARLQYKSATIGGSSLGHHNIDWLTEPGRIGVAQPFELVVLAGNSGDALSPAGQAEFRSAATQAAKTVRARGAQVAIYMVHAWVKPHRQAKPENIRAIEKFYVDVGNELNALVLPIGLAFEEAYKRHPELTAQGLNGLHQDYDGSHPSPLGSYLAAATAYAAIYGKSPVGNGFDFYGKVSAADRLKMQQVAQDVVQRFFAAKPN
jgi:hypothetical protein